MVESKICPETNGGLHDAVGEPHVASDSPLSGVKRKIAKIKQAISMGDAVTLRALALSEGGLVEDELRKDAWPIMLGIKDPYTYVERPSPDQIEKHVYHQQVQLDVARSIKRFPPSIPTDSRLGMQDSLVSLIMRVLVANPNLHYYQGYHDICVTVLLVVDGNEDLAFKIVEKVSLEKLHVYMESSMQPTANLLQLVYPLLETQDASLRNFLDESGCGIMFCLSWCITWFGHDVEHYPSLVRLYDLFLATNNVTVSHADLSVIENIDCIESPLKQDSLSSDIVNHYLKDSDFSSRPLSPDYFAVDKISPFGYHLMPIYLTAAVLLSHSKSLQELECSLPSVHCYLSKIISGCHPSQDISTEISSTTLSKEMPHMVLDDGNRISDVDVDATANKSEDSPLLLENENVNQPEESIELEKQIRLARKLAAEFPPAELERREMRRISYLERERQRRRAAAALQRHGVNNYLGVTRFMVSWFAGGGGGGEGRFRRRLVGIIIVAAVAVAFEAYRRQVVTARANPQTIDALELAVNRTDGFNEAI